MAVSVKKLKQPDGSYLFTSKTGVKLGWAKKSQGGWYWGLMIDTSPRTKAPTLSAIVNDIEKHYGFPLSKFSAEPEKFYRRVKTGDQSYVIYSTEDQSMVGYVVKVGTYRDNYPWEWRLENSEGASKGVGVEDSMSKCIETMMRIHREKKST